MKEAPWVILWNERWNLFWRSGKVSGAQRLQVHTSYEQKQGDLFIYLFLKLIKIDMILKAQKPINYAVLKDNQSRHLLHTTNWDTVLKEMASKCKLIAFIDKNMCPLEDRPHSLPLLKVHEPRALWGHFSSWWGAHGSPNSLENKLWKLLSSLCGISSSNLSPKPQTE